MLEGRQNLQQHWLSARESLSLPNMDATVTMDLMALL